MVITIATELIGQFYDFLKEREEQSLKRYEIFLTICRYFIQKRGNADLLLNSRLKVWLIV